MPKIVDNKIYHNGEKIGWIEGSHVRDENGNKLGYCQGDFVFNEAAHKVAYIQENELHFENGQPAVPLEKINEEIEGSYSLILKCAVHVLLED